jgi:ATP-dependent Clp protease protease subunit
MSSDSTKVLTIEDQVHLAQAKALDVEAKALELKLRDLLTSSVFARQITIAGPIHAELSQAVISLMAHWRRIDGEGSRRDIQIILNSTGEVDDYGESFVETFALFDYIRWMRASGYRFKVQVTGIAARQAAVLLQVADERVITPNSAIVLTEAQFPGFRGDSASARDLVAFRKELDKHGRQLLVGRTGGKLTLEQLKERTEYDRQWWLPSAAAVELGLVDRIGTDLQSSPDLPSISVVLDPGDPPLVRKQKAEQRLNLLKAEVARLEMQELEAASMNPRVCCFFGPVTAGSVAQAGKILQNLARVKGADIELILNSPGGSVQDGLALMDVIEAIKASGVKVTTVALGQAASMGGFLLQSGTHRVMGKNARLLIHRISRIFGGSSSQLEDQEEHMRRLEAQALPLLAGRSKLTVEEIRARSEHRDWWLTAEEALELGFVDEVR